MVLFGSLCSLIFSIGLAEAKISDKELASLKIQLPKLSGRPISLSQLRQGVEELDRLWRRKQDRLARVHLKMLREQQRDLGVYNFFSLATLLVRHGDRLLKVGQPKLATFYYREAAACAPSSAEPIFRQIFSSLRQNIFAIVPALRALILGVKKSFGYFLNRMVLEAQLFAFFFIVFVVIFVFFTFSLLLRTIRLFVAELKRFLPDLGWIQSSLLAFSLLSFPLWMTGAWFETFCCWILLSWWFFSNLERVLLSVCLLFFAFLPELSTPVDQLIMFRGSTLEAIYLVNETEEADLHVERLLKSLHKKPRQYNILFTLASFYQRQGDSVSAGQFFERANALKKTAELYVNMGNQAFFRNKSTEAFRFYEKALRLSPRMPEACFNTSIVLKHSRRTAVIKENIDYLDIARKQRTGRVEQFLFSSKKQLNRIVMQAAFLPNKYIQSSSQQLGFFAFFWGRTTVWIPSSYSMHFILGLLFGLWLLLPFGRRLFSSTACYECGVMCDFRTEPYGRLGIVCDACKKLLLKREEVSVSSRVERELMIQRYQKGRFRYFFFLSIFLPGGSSLFFGKTFKGFFYLFLLGVYGAFFFLQKEILVHPFYLGDSDFVHWFLLVGGALLLVMHIWSLKRVFRR